MRKAQLSRRTGLSSHLRFDQPGHDAAQSVIPAMPMMQSRTSSLLAACSSLCVGATSGISLTVVCDHPSLAIEEDMLNFMVNVGEFVILNTNRTSVKYLSGSRVFKI